MSREQDIQTMEQFAESDNGVICNHVGFLDWYSWGITCGNCGAAWKAKKDMEPK